MILNDVIYGKFDINNPVLIELLKSKDLTRLKGVSQSGTACFNTGEGYTAYSRFEHSVGVMLLLRRLGAPLEEQVAGLLHDSSHPAFSHVIDFVFDTRGAENYAEDDLLSFIKRSQIGAILAKHGLDAERIGKPEVKGRFPLLEQPRPKMCGDRVDNGLRYMHYAGLDISGIVDDFTVFDGEMVLKSRASAKKLGEGFLHGTKAEWGNLEKGLRAHFLAEAIRTGMELKVFEVSELYTLDEANIIKRLRKSGNKLISNNLNLITADLKYVQDDNGEISVIEAPRYLDPTFLSGGKRYNLTGVDPDYKKRVEEENDFLRKKYNFHLLN